MHIEADRLRLLGGMLQLIPSWPIVEDVGISDNVKLETGSGRGHCLASMKF